MTNQLARSIMSEIGLFDAMCSARSSRCLNPTQGRRKSSPVCRTPPFGRLLLAMPKTGSSSWCAARSKQAGCICREASDIASESTGRGRPVHMTDEQYRRLMTAGAYLWDHMGDAPLLTQHHSPVARSGSGPRSRRTTSAARMKSKRCLPSV